MHLSVQGAPCPSSRQQRVILGQQRDSVPSGTPGKDNINDVITWSQKEKSNAFLHLFVFLPSEEFTAID